MQKLKSDNKFNLIYYKPQDVMDNELLNLKKEDFVLIIMNNYQQSMLQKYGELVELVLGDMLFPCFMISNRVDEVVLRILFSKIKNLTGQFKSKVFMSDMADSFYNAWIAEMEPPQHRLYCKWHVDRTWRKNLSKIKSKEKQANIHKILRTLFHEQDSRAF